jgi:hypothetical protein
MNGINKFLKENERHPFSFLPVIYSAMCILQERTGLKASSWKQRGPTSPHTELLAT